MQAAGCLDENRVQEFLEGLLSDAARGNVESHIDHCADCRRLLSEAAKRVLARDIDDTTRDYSTHPDIDKTSVHIGPSYKPGAMLGDIRVMRMLGRGGMGEVYLARDTKLGRKIALKVIKPQLAQSEKALKKFQQEARITARLNHPNIVTIHNVGEHEGAPWLALEYVHGRSLRERVEEIRALHASVETTSRGSVPAVGVGAAGAAEAARVGLAIARALAHAHENGVLHLDLKPDNVLIGEDGRVRVVDFGLARLASATTPNAAGTPHYMAPEQWNRQGTSDRTDIWALGVTLYLLLSGQRPFDGKSKEMIRDAICAATPSPRVDRVAVVPDALTELVAQCLHKDPNKRPDANTSSKVLEDILQRARPRAEQEESPFRGLRAFREQDAHLFFGRDAEVATFVERVRVCPVLPVVGASGAGKSSFVQAGVLPRLRELGRWKVLQLRPSARPFATLAHRMSRDAPIDAQQLSDEPRALGVHLLEIARKHGLRVLLFIDQLEELFTLCHDPAECRRFLDALALAADDADDPVRVVFTLRDDFLGRIAVSAPMRKALSHVTVLHSPEPAALREIVTKPLEQVGYRYDDPLLVDHMIEAVGGASSLPLVEFAVQLLWEQRDKDRRVLLRSAYESLGGVAGALTRHADSVLDGFSPEELSVARALLLRMVSPEGTRRSISRSRALDGLDAAIPVDIRATRIQRRGSVVESPAANVLTRLIEARLVSITKVRGDADGESTLELTHESLVRSWPTLARWLDESREQIALASDLAQAAQLWEKRGRSDDALWRGSALEDAKRALSQGDAEIDDTVRAFIAQSSRAERRRHIRRQAFAIGSIGASVLIAVAAVFAALVIYDKEQEAQHARDKAERQRASAMLAAAQSAADQGKRLEARARLRMALEAGDSTAGRALWWRLAADPLMWTHALGPYMYDVAFAPDGRSIAAASQHAGVHLIDAQTRSVEWLRGPEDQTLAVAYSPDSKRLVTGAWNGIAVIWDVARRSVIRTLEGHDSAVPSVAFSADGAVIATGGADRTVRLWNAETGQHIRTLRGHGGGVRAVAFSPKGIERFASATATGSIVLWNAATGKRLHIVEGEASVRSIAFASDGQRFATGDLSGAARIWSFSKGEELHRFDGAPVLRVAFRMSDKQLATAGQDGSIRFWDIAAGKVVHRIQAHKEEVSGMAFGPNGAMLASSSYDKRVRMWRVDGAPTKQANGGHGAPVSAIEFDDNGARVVTGGADRTARIWDTKTGALLDVLRGHERQVTDVDIHGDLIATASFDTDVRVWNKNTGKVVRVLTGHTSEVRAVSFNESGRLLASAGEDGTVRLWNVATGGEKRVLRKHTDQVHGVSFSPDGNLLVSAGRDSRVHIWNLDKRGEPQTVSGPPRPVMGALFNPVREELAIVGPGSVIRIHNYDGEPIREHKASGRLYRASYHPDGHRIAVASADGRALIIDTRDDSRVTCEGHRAEVNDVAFSSDGTLLATGSDDTTARIWTADDCTPLWRAPLMLSAPARLFTHRGWLSLRGGEAAEPFKPKLAATIANRTRHASPRGRVLCALTHDGGVELWDIDQDSAVSKLEDPATQVLATSEGCAAIARGGQVRWLTPTGPVQRIGTHKTAGSIGFDGKYVWVGDDKEVTAYDKTGARVERIAAAGMPDVLLPLDDRVIVAYAGGGIDTLWRVADRERVALREVPSTTATALAAGPRATIAAGFTDGIVALWDGEDGSLLYRARLHGSVMHILYEDGHLHFASNLGDHISHDVQAFERPYCELMDTVWAQVPITWHSGRAEGSLPPNDHPCGR